MIPIGRASLVARNRLTINNPTRNAISPKTYTVLVEIEVGSDMVTREFHTHGADGSAILSSYRGGPGISTVGERLNDRVVARFHRSTGRNDLVPSDLTRSIAGRHQSGLLIENPDVREIGGFGVVSRRIEMNERIDLFVGLRVQIDVQQRPSHRFGEQCRRLPSCLFLRIQRKQQQYDSGCDHADKRQDGDHTNDAASHG